jgi:hypothetical protein
VQLIATRAMLAATGATTNYAADRAFASQDPKAGHNAQMLANDSYEQKQQGGYSVLVNAGRGVAELIAECRRCGAITKYGLELAWRLQVVTCPECATTMRLTEGELVALREGLIEARRRIDRLIRLQTCPSDEEPASPEPPLPQADT